MLMDCSGNTLCKWCEVFFSSLRGLYLGQIEVKSVLIECLQSALCMSSPLSKSNTPLWNLDNWDKNIFLFGKIQVKCERLFSAVHFFFQDHSLLIETTLSNTSTKDLVGQSPNQRPTLPKEKLQRLPQPLNRRISIKAMALGQCQHS